MTTIYQLTGNQLITTAIGKLGVLAQNQNPTAEDLSKGLASLNLLVARLKTKGLQLWKRSELSFTMTVGNPTVSMGMGKTLNVPYATKLLQAYRQDSSGGARIPMEIKSREDYNMLPTNSSGTPVQLTYQPFIDYGVISVWPTPVDTNYTITISYQAPFEFFTTGLEVADFPEEYYLPIIYNLAVLLAPEWGIPPTDRNELKEEANLYLAEVEGFGIEDGSFYIQPR